MLRRHKWRCLAWRVEVADEARWEDALEQRQGGGVLIAPARDELLTELSLGPWGHRQAASGCNQQENSK